jgi:C4-dicarboxylate transporter, DctQ subunit
MKFLTRLGKIFDLINIIMVVISSVAFVAMILLVGTDITLRYFFNKPLGWVTEVSTYILVMLGFLVAAWILKDDGHIKMDLILVSVSPRTRCVLDILTSIISIIIVFIICWFSMRVMADFYATNFLNQSVLKPPKWILIVPIFIGALLLMVQFIRKVYGFILRWKTLTRQMNFERAPRAFAK